MIRIFYYSRGNAWVQNYLYMHSVGLGMTHLSLKRVAVEYAQSSDLLVMLCPCGRKLEASTQISQFFLPALLHLWQAMRKISL